MGRPLSGPEPALPPCDVPHCPRQRVYAQRLYCGRHHQRWAKHGDPLAGGRERRQKGSGHVGDDGYVTVMVGGRKRPKHVWVMEAAIGRELVHPETVHHKNGVRDDNRLGNLELWSSAQPGGQRVLDKLTYAREILALYGHLDPAVVG
jgi:hypothetical protein